MPDHNKRTQKLPEEALDIEGSNDDLDADTETSPKKKKKIAEEALWEEEVAENEIAANLHPIETLEDENDEDEEESSGEHVVSHIETKQEEDAIEATPDIVEDLKEDEGRDDEETGESIEAQLVIAMKLKPEPPHPRQKIIEPKKEERGLLEIIEALLLAFKESLSRQEGLLHRNFNQLRLVFSQEATPKSGYLAAGAASVLVAMPASLVKDFEAYVAQHNPQLQLQHNPNLAHLAFNTTAVIAPTPSKTMRQTATTTVVPPGLAAAQPLGVPITAATLTNTVNSALTKTGLTITDPSSAIGMQIRNSARAYGSQIEAVSEKKASPAVKEARQLKSDSETVKTQAPRQEEPSTKSPYKTPRPRPPSPPGTESGA